MARIPYADTGRADIAPLAARIKAERGGKLLNLYRMLLQSPPVAEGWLAFLTAIRQQSGLAARVRELVIMRVAVLNAAEYEFQAHLPFVQEEGVTEAQIAGLRAGDTALFDERERAALAYADAMTRAIRVPDDVFAAVRRHFDDREIVELTATVGAYNLVSRFLEALRIDHD
ncbi:MAG TPA: carboxymuconolactone decarboxylase family protein [Burkholderiales bacterium]|nr:carboxymuconolactone decarboxylase family protein [Burkholderiales bacterium]